ncbi:MAG: Uma2 family endonuclease [Planctomycetaceae bacterium]
MSSITAHPHEPPPERLRMSREEYLAFEETAEVRHEFYKGELFAMSGGTAAHSRLKVRLTSLLDQQTSRGGCQTFDSDMRARRGLQYLHLPGCVCDLRQACFENECRNSLLNPQAIFEVLSDSTEAYDRGEKFQHYLQLDSLRHYVLVSQSKRRVDCFTRDDDGNWRFHFAGGVGGVLDLQMIGCRLALDELYDGIELTPPAAAPLDQPQGQQE